MTKHDNCPSCRVSLIGDSIPENIREHYHPPYVWRREIGIEDPEMEKGLKYDSEKIPLDLLSSEALLGIAQVLAQGAKKYGRHNWRNGLHYSRLIAAALRHLLAFNAGEDLDPETKLSHLCHAGACVMFLIEQLKTHPELDDRYKVPK